MECLRDGISPHTWNTKLTSAAYMRLKKGVEVVREIVIAVNKDSNGNFNARPVGPSFSTSYYDGIRDNLGVTEAGGYVADAVGAAMNKIISFSVYIIKWEK